MERCDDDMIKKYINGKYVDVSKEEIQQSINAQEEYKKSSEYKQSQITELKQKLDDTDYAIIKIAEGSATVDEYADLIEQRKAWRNEINELEKQL